MRFPHSVVTVGSLWLSVVVGSLTLAPKSAVSAWTVGTPIVTYWAGPGYDSSVPLTETAARQMADFGINLVWASSAAEVDLAGRFGLRAMYQNRTVLVPEYLDGGTLQQHIDRAVGELRTKPAMYAYFLADEFSPKRFAPLRSLKDYLDKLDPDHVAYMDIFPTYGAPIEGLDYMTYLNRYVDTVKPALLSYNHYQFRIGADWSGYLDNLAIIREKAKSKAIPFMNVVQEPRLGSTRGYRPLPKETISCLHDSRLWRPRHFLLCLVLAAMPRHRRWHCQRERCSDADLRNAQTGEPRVRSYRQTVSTAPIHRSLSEGVSCRQAATGHRNAANQLAI